MNPLVHDWARNRLDKVARQDAWEQALSVLALVSNNIERKPFSLRLVPHIDTCARDIISEKSRAQLSLNVVRAFFFLALMYYNHGRYEESLAVYETLSVSFKVPPHTWSCKSSALLRARARCLDMLRRHEDMYSCVNQILQTTTRWFKPDSPEAYTAQALLADTHHLAGNFQDEADLCESLYERNSRTFVLDDRNTSELLTGHAIVGRAASNLSKSVPTSSSIVVTLDENLTRSVPHRGCISRRCYISRGRGQLHAQPNFARPLVYRAHVEFSRSLWKIGSIRPSEPNPRRDAISLR